MKRIIIIIATIFAVALAITIGLRVSSDAMAVIIGVILGIVATTPATILLMYFLGRQHTAPPAMPPPYAQPPVVVVNGNERQTPYPSAAPALPATASNGSRRWTVIGDEAND